MRGHILLRLLLMGRTSGLATNRIFAVAGAVIKFRASDGAVLDTFTVGEDPQGLAFDGTYMWVVNTSDGHPNGTVTKMRASDGVAVGTFNVAVGPVGIAFDGANMWVASVGNTLTKLRASDGATVGIFSAPGVFNAPFAVCL
jgi:hypothetical protein